MGEAKGNISSVTDNTTRGQYEVKIGDKIFATLTSEAKEEAERLMAEGKPVEIQFEYVRNRGNLITSFRSVEGKK